jgi:gliding motility-associatede transport system auxiliary component
MHRKLIDLLGPLGLLIAVAAAAWVRTGRQLPGGLGVYVLVGAALVLVHTVLRWDDVGGAIGGRQLRYGGNTFVLVLVVVGILGALNYLAFRHNKRVDLTEGGRHSLSDQTRKVVSGLSEDVKITYFGRSPELLRGRERLRDYEALSDRLAVEYVDPVKDPIKAQSFGVRPPYPVVFVDRGERREKITNDSEQDLTNALIKVFRDETKTVCFVEGEGERDSADFSERGFSAVKDALGESQYETKTITPIRDSSVPEDCTVVVVAAPESDLLPPVVEALDAYVTAGGGLLVMVEPPFEGSQTNLEAMLADWNIETGKDVVLDVSGVGQLFGTGALAPLALSYPYHEITKDFRLTTAFATARRVEAGSGGREGVVAQNLAETAPQAWAETDLSLNDPKPDEGVDTLGPVSLGAVATVPAPESAADDAADSAETEPAAEATDGDEAEADADGAEPEKAAEEDPTPAPRDGRVVAFGDADFASNGYLSFEGNRDLLLNSVAWLAEDADLISVRPKEPEDQRVFLTQLQQGNVTFVALILLPGIFVAAGIANWWRRR